jgi:hypothetical protein
MKKKYIYNFISDIIFHHIKGVPCHHCMVCPQVSDEGNGPHIHMWTVDKYSLLNKQWWTGNGMVLQSACYEILQWALGHGRIILKDKK